MSDSAVILTLLAGAALFCGIWHIASEKRKNPYQRLCEAWERAERKTKAVRAKLEHAELEERVLRAAIDEENRERSVYISASGERTKIKPL